LIRHYLEISATRKRGHTRLVIVGGAIFVVFALGGLVYAHVNSANSHFEVTAYSHTGVVGARGLAAQGKFVWIADAGVLPQGATGINHGEKVVRIDVATGTTKSIDSPLFSAPFAVVTTQHYVWVLNAGFVTHRLSLLRINEATLAVTNVNIPPRIQSGFAYSQGGYVVAGGYLWISTTEGIVRVNTSTLAVSRITSPLLTGGPFGPDMVADAHYVWLSESVLSKGSSFLVRVSIDTGAVTKVIFPGFIDGAPIADNGTDLWVADSVGLQRFNLTTGRGTLISLPDGVGLSLSPSGLDAVANGSVYLAATVNGNNSQGVIVRVDNASGRVTVASSPFMQLLTGVTAANGTVWADNWPEGKVHQPVLVRVS
jgi:hypothetical protein